MGVDLHLHSTASDGIVAPEAVPAAAKEAGIHTIALTDHDTLDGIVPAATSGRELGVRVIAGCEFSVGVWWGELHLLGYFLPVGEPTLDRFLAEQRSDREGRIGEILSKLDALGVSVGLESVAAEADRGSMGRPHVARAMVNTGVVSSVDEAFHRYLADGKRAFVPRRLVDVQRVVQLVRGLGGVTSAAHLKGRGTRDNLRRLRNMGVDAIEVRHPSHAPNVVARLHKDATELGLLKTGGSDWHGSGGQHRDTIGAMDVPEAWLEKIEGLHHERAA